MLAEMSMAPEPEPPSNSLADVLVTAMFSVKQRHFFVSQQQ